MIHHKTSSNLERQIMRRVYTAFILTTIFGGVGRPAFWYGVLSALAVAIFRAEVHVMSVYHNVLSVPLGDVPRYLQTTFTNAIAAGELLKVGSVVILGYLTVWAVRQCWQFYALYRTTPSHRSGRFS